MAPGAARRAGACLALLTPNGNPASPPRRVLTAVTTGLVLLTSFGELGADQRAAPAPHTKSSWPAVEAWRQPQGLPQNSSFSAPASQRNGYLWVAPRAASPASTASGSTTFDDRDKTHLRENEVRSLAEGDDGSVWIATFGGGLSRFTRLAALPEGLHEADGLIRRLRPSPL